MNAEMNAGDGNIAAPAGQVAQANPAEGDDM